MVDFEASSKAVGSFSLQKKEIGCLSPVVI
jgi:hypothetical protein